MKLGINEKIVFSLLMMLQLVINTSMIVNGSMAPPAVPPTFTELAEISDIIFTGKLINIDKDENFTHYKFTVYEYIKNPQNTTTFTLQIPGGLSGPISSWDASFDLNKEYFVFTVPVKTRYIVPYGEYGVRHLSDVSQWTIINLKYIYDPNNTILFQDLMISPYEIYQGKNTTIRFNITNKQENEATIGFIIEHHPPPYQIIDEENMTLKYLQYAKSVIVPARSTITYEYILSSNYAGVNTIVINYQGGPKLTDTFKVNRYSNFMGNPETVTFEINPRRNYIPLFLIAGIFTLGAILHTIYRKPVD
ncbi:hypothetical protein E4H04_11880 [Candidatus Bathyarchaeota archaeon]|nr:MAG: hypothetical protein E4H04_11880 [Candidatus Bathyarchaeota archaeon]